MIRSSTFNGYKMKIPTSFEGYNVLEIINCGGTSVVALVEDQNMHSKYSAKIISKKYAIEQHLLQSIESEIKILKMINHPNIIQFYDSFEIYNDDKEKLIVIITEYCSNGDLLNFALNHQNEFQKKSIQLKIFNGFLSSIKYLHEKRISHCDIKAENILLDSNLNPKLCDFGYSQTTVFQNDESFKRGTVYYLAPELCHPGAYNTLKADIYAIGILIYSLIELKFPVHGGSEAFVYSQISKGKLFFRKDADKKLLNLVIRCTFMDPKKRPSIDEIIKDEYFYEENEMKLDIPYFELLKINAKRYRAKKLEKQILSYILKNKNDKKENNINKQKQKK